MILIKVIIILFVSLATILLFIISLFYHKDEEEPNHVNVWIRCPECGEVQMARVVFDFPFNIYLHNCIECGAGEKPYKRR